MDLSRLLEAGDDDSVALLDIDGATLSYAALRAHSAGATTSLHELGLASGDSAAILMPNGPEMATVFLASAMAAVSAPLNPAYRKDELEFYLADLDPKLLLIGADLESPARDVARARGIRVVEIGRNPGAPGRFTVNGVLPVGRALHACDAGATALVLHTSGTTSRPKIVPLTHANLVASARHIAATWTSARPTAV